MKREDIGFVVSRALAIWIAVIAIREIYPILNAILQNVGLLTSSKRSSGSDTRYLTSAVISAGTVFVAELVLIVFLWTKAKSFVPAREVEDAPEDLVPHDGPQFQTAIVSVVGLILLIEGLASVGSVILDQYFVKQLGSMQQMSARADWQGAAFEAVIGVLVLITCRYPNWFKRLYTYTGYPKS